MKLTTQEGKLFLNITRAVWPHFRAPPQGPSGLIGGWIKPIHINCSPLLLIQWQWIDAKQSWLFFSLLFPSTKSI